MDERIWVWALLILWEHGQCWKCLCLRSSGVGDVGGEWVGLVPGSGVVGWCYVYMSCLDSLCRWQVQVSVFVHGRYRKSRLVCAWVSDLDLCLHHPLL